MYKKYLVLLLVFLFSACSHTVKPQEVKGYEKVFEAEDRYIVLDVSIDCSSGTYIRSIAKDLGERLGIGAVLFELIRIKEGNFRIRDCFKIKVKN